MPIFIEMPELLPRFRAGDAHVLERVYLTYAANLERTIRFGMRLKEGGSWVPGVGPFEDPRDLVHDVFVRAFAPRARHAYDGQRPYGPWLFALARNLLVDRGRSLRGTRKLLLGEPPAIGNGAPLPPDDLCDVRRVARYLNHIPPALRAVHEARYVQDHSERAAAERLGISRQVLRSQERRLRDGLRAFLCAAPSEDDPAIPNDFLAAAGIAAREARRDSVAGSDRRFSR